MKRLIVAIVLTGVSAATLVLVPAGLGSPTGAQASCGAFTGPAWTSTSSLTGERKKGTSWNVTARRVACAFALKTAKTLVKTPFKGEARTKLASPAGWSCIAGGGNSHGGRGTPGYCSQGSKSLQWGPTLGS